MLVEPVIELLRQGGLALLAEQLTGALDEGGELDHLLQSAPLLLSVVAASVALAQSWLSIQLALNELLQPEWSTRG